MEIAKMIIDYTMKALDGVNPITQLVRLSLADPKMLTLEIKGEKTCYFYRFKFELDEKKYYDEFLPRFEALDERRENGEEITDDDLGFASHLVSVNRFIDSIQMILVHAKVTSYFLMQMLCIRIILN